MTQAIIPGCEANPDPTTVINVDPTKPMKEIPMDELKRDCDTDKKMQDSFDTLLVSSANAAENGKELLEENKRLNEECEQLVRRNHELYDELAALRGDSPKMKEVLEEFDIKDASDLEGKMNLLVYDEDILEKHGISDREELDERLENSSKATLRSVLGTIHRSVTVDIVTSVNPGLEDIVSLTGIDGGAMVSRLERSAVVDGGRILSLPVQDVSFHDNYGLVVKVYYNTKD